MAAPESPADSELVEKITEQVEEWSSNSNEALHITLQRQTDSGPVKLAIFHPEFTYPIYGEEESLFGYKGLKIDLTFAAHNLRPTVKITYDERFKQMGEVKPSDVEEPLREFLPASAFSSGLQLQAQEETPTEPFRPPGTLMHSYTNSEGHKFEIWCSSLADPATRTMLNYVQILVPLFIEGGSLIDLDDPQWTIERWKVFLLYQVHDSSNSSPTESPYALLGYSTSYRIFALPRPTMAESSSSTPAPYTGHVLESDLISPPYPQATPLDLPSRERISQFLILPPYQGSGHGRQLYRTMYSHLTSAPNVLELTVEDPNEAFDDLRDLCDLAHLRTIPAFADLTINPNIPKEKLANGHYIPTDLIVPESLRTTLRTAAKLAQRQFDRLVEMHTLSAIPPAHRSTARITRRENSSADYDRMYYFWRLYVKQRLYVFNSDQLAQLDRQERIERLEATVESVRVDYERLLALAEKWASYESVGDGEAGVGALGSGQRRRKRKIVDEDEDDDEGEGGIGDGVADAMLGATTTAADAAEDEVTASSNERNGAKRQKKT
ncbi:histone acetyltransferase 1 [Elasticomyces elasticus]|nr:histone acetyltransferase 1 [Elasticomyces elasticus]